MRDPAEIADFAEKYVTYETNERDPSYWTGLPLSDDEDALLDFVLSELADHPEDAWPFILAVVERDHQGLTFPVLAAGPLEVLLSKDGAAFIERVEAEARSNPRFATLLGGVWKSSMTDDVWIRVAAAWDRRGWDGEQLPDDHWWQSGSEELTRRMSRSTDPLE